MSQIWHATSNTHCEMHHLKEKWKQRASMYKYLLRKLGIRIPTDTVSAPSMGPSANGPQSQSPNLVWTGLSYAKSKQPSKGHLFS